MPLGISDNSTSFDVEKKEARHNASLSGRLIRYQKKIGSIRCEDAVRNKPTVRKNPEKSEPSSTSQTLQKSWVKNAGIALLSATGGAVAEAYSNFLSQNLNPLFLSLVAWVQDQVFPMPLDQQIVAQLTFYISAKVDKERSAEVMAVGLYGKECRRPGGKIEVRTFDQGERDNYTEALVRGSCRPSGRTKVTITPRNGSPITLYHGIFNDGEKIEFGGVPGSYEYGVLTLILVGTKEPTGPRLPVNQ